MSADPGVYPRKALLAMGYDDAAIRRAVASGDLVRLRTGWFAIAGHDPAVADAVRAGGALACVSALKWHGLWVPPGYPDTHVRRARTGAGIRPGCAAFGGVRAVVEAVDPAPWALACAVRCMRAEDWVATCDSYFHLTGTSADDLVAALGRPGPAVRRLLGRTDARSESGTESIVRLRLLALGYAVVVQPILPGVGRVDLRIGKLLIECDGRQYHSDVAAFTKDRARDRRAVIDGWITMRLTYDDVLFGWDETLQDIRAITAAGRHRIRGGRVANALARSLDRADEC